MEQSTKSIKLTLHALSMQACTGLLGVSDSYCSIYTCMPGLYNKRRQMFGNVSIKNVILAFLALNMPNIRGKT